MHVLLKLIGATHPSHYVCVCLRSAFRLFNNWFCIVESFDRVNHDNVILHPPYLLVLRRSCSLAMVRRFVPSLECPARRQPEERQGATRERGVDGPASLRRPAVASARLSELEG